MAQTIDIEPTGPDFWNLICTIASQRSTILVTTRRLDEVGRAVRQGLIAKEPVACA
jgi:hypothetical protein